MSGLTSLINRLQIVKQIPVFSKLNWFDLQRIARKATLQEFKKGEIISKQGDPPDFFFCLVSGRIQAYTLGTDKVKGNVDFLHRGMHFGIISVFTGEAHSMTFEAINDSIVLKILKDDFHTILKTVPALGIEFTQSLSKRVRSHVSGRKQIFESHIISIYSPIVGTGSSTYSINLALNLQQETKQKVVLLNIHARRKNEESLTSHEEDTSPVWENAIELKDIIGDHDKVFDSITKGELDIDFLNVIFDSEDISLKKMISPLVSTLVGAYHYVIVDLPNNMDDYVFETLTQSDNVHLLSMDRRKDFDMIKKVLNRLEKGLQENFNVDKIKVIVRGVRDQIYLSYEDINKTIDFDVFTFLPHIKSEQLKGQLHTKGITIQRCDPSSEYAKVIRRIARQIGGVMVGVVLGGGAALGIAHIGVIRVLEEEGIPVDVVVGSSMGALIGSMWAVGNDASQLEAIARDFEKKKDMWKLFDPFIIPLSGLIGDRAIMRWLRKYLSRKTFYACQIPFKVIAYDLVRREELVLNSGDLARAVRKSIAIPGVLEPVKEDGKWIIDGGVLNPLPTNIPAGLGIKKIIAVNVLQSPEVVSQGQDIIDHAQKEQKKIPFSKSPWEFISFRIGQFFKKLTNPNIPDIIVRTLQASEYVISEQSAQQADVMIEPDLVGINWFELYRVDDLIKSGEDATRKVLPEIKKLVSVEVAVNKK